MSRNAVVAALVAVALSTAGVASASSASAEEFHTHYHSPTAVGGTTYFAGYERTKGVELFSTDGTAAGTKLVKDIFRGSPSAFIDYAYGEGANLDPEFTAVGGKTVFRASGPSGVQLWVTDGTAAGTVQLTNESIFRSGQFGAYPTSLTAFNGKVYFNADSATLGFELWETDGTVAGTKVASDIIPPNVEHKKNGKTIVAGSHPYGFAVAGDILYFKAAVRPNGVLGEGLYQTDGTTTKLDVTLSSADGSAGGADLTALGDQVIWPASQSSSASSGIWISDGTDAGTHLYSSGTGSTLFGDLFAFDGSIYYPGFSGSLWKATGDGEPPVQIAANLDGSRPQFAFAGGKLWYFGHDTTTHVQSLWTINSGGAAPVLVKNLDATTQSWPGLASAWLGGELYFVQHGALWKSDGSQAGTTKVTNLGPSGGIGFAELGVAGNGIAIALQNSHEVDQLWLSDGTAEGTSKVLPLSTFSKAPVPTIVGKAKVGTKLAGRIGVWSPADPTFTYQWKANGVAIGSATSKYFTLTSAQSGKKITFTVKATKSGYVTRSRTSVATAKVTG